VDASFIPVQSLRQDAEDRGVMVEDFAVLLDAAKQGDEAAIRQLPVDHAEVILLRVVAGLHMARVATECTGESVTT
jgi:hypothetical protein